jgi:hypothetical protein
MEFAARAGTRREAGVASGGEEDLRGARQSALKTRWQPDTSRFVETHNDVGHYDWSSFGAANSSE